MALERTFDNVADPQSSDSLIELAEDAAVRFGANAPQTLTARDEAASKLASEGRLGLVKMYEEETLGRRLSMKKSENAREDEATLDNRMRLARYYSERYDTKNAISQLRAVLRTLEAHDHLDWGRIVEARNELICELWMEDQTEVTSEVIEISMKTLDQAHLLVSGVSKKLSVISKKILESWNLWVLRKEHQDNWKRL
ncbi:hypothetical protein BFW01_g9904 [Lasiodiplodia theobromae]|nr:hypothetical protein BFW01_g9904 [Lasiodiplodia theobromae]